MAIRPAGGLDKFYTSRVVARLCKEALFEIIKRPDHVLEPSAGGGSWIEPRDGVVAFDLQPELSGALQIDSLTPHLESIMRAADLDEFLSIGNPPFGHNSQVAVAFVNQFLSIGHIIAFILPIAFRKWSVQCQISPAARLVLDRDVSEYAFELPSGKPYGIRTCFQAWTVRDCDKSLPDLRLKSKPPIAHADFVMKRYNCTLATRAHLGEGWDLAVPAQGFVDYGVRVHPGGSCRPSAQWMLFFSEFPDVLERIDKIDFRKLSRRNAMMPGFGKADVVEAYSALLAAERPETGVGHIAGEVVVDGVNRPCN
jgi:hypothetical protein